MKRKVVRQGQQTLMVSLPSDWAKKVKLKKGDELEVEERGKTLLVSLEKEHFDKETELNIDNLYPMTLRTVAAIYKAGYDKMKVTFSDPKRIADVHNVSRNEISGFEVIEQGKNYCIVKKVEEGIGEGFEPILRRTFLLLLTMAEESLESIKKNDYEDLKRLRYLEETNNRFTTYCRRYLSKKGYKEHNKIQFIYHIVEQLEIIADQYKFMFDYLIEPRKKQIKLSKETIEYYDKVNRLFRMYYELFYSFEKEKMVKIGLLRQELSKDINKNIEKGGHDAVIMHYLAILTQIIFELVEPYLSMVL